MQGSVVVVAVAGGVMRVLPPVAGEGVDSAATIRRPTARKSIPIPARCCLRGVARDRVVARVDVM